MLDYQQAYKEHGSYAAAARALGVNESTVRRACKKNLTVLPTSNCGTHQISVTENIQIIGDTHLPAEHTDYLDFNCAVRDKYKLTTTLHAGDVVDHHALSYHESDPDLPSVGDELDLVRSRLEDWYYEFPELTITCGNHDLLPSRKAMTHGLPKAMLRGYNELLGTPETWTWTPKPVTFNLACGMPVAMQHGISSSMQAGTQKLRTASLIQGHHHFTAGVAWNTAPNWRLFFLSVGCGVDPSHPAMAYANSGVLKMPILGCGIIVEGYAAHLPMWLDNKGRWNGVVP
jgi:predicted phosphodiesterase